MDGWWWRAHGWWWCTDDELLEGGEVVLGEDRGVEDGLELLRGDLEHGAHVPLEAGQHLVGLEHERRDHRHRAVGDGSHD